jgi:hypothetical protein
MRHIYSHKHYCRRIKTLLGEYKAPKIEIPLDFRQFLTFFRSNVRLGIFGKERFQYWRLLVWTLFRRPELFSLAINTFSKNSARSPVPPPLSSQQVHILCMPRLGQKKLRSF